MISFFFSWTNDQSLVNSIFDESIEINNIGKKFGLTISYYLIFKGFGIGSLFLPVLIFFIGLSLTFNSGINKIFDRTILSLLFTVWLSLFCSYFIDNQIYGGVFGFEIKFKIIEFIGDIGFISILLFGFLSFLIVKLKITPHFLYSIILSNVNKIDLGGVFKKTSQSSENFFNNELDNEIDDESSDSENEIKPTIQNFSKIDNEFVKDNDTNNINNDVVDKVDDEIIDDIKIDVEKITNEETVEKLSLIHI